MESKMFTLAIAPVIVWLGVLAYVFVMERKIARLESKREQDDL
jgi:hypothetical protein